MTDPEILRKAEIIADMVMTERTDAVKEYHRLKDLVDRLEEELALAQDDLETIIDKLDAMGVVEYQ